MDCDGDIHEHLVMGLIDPGTVKLVVDLGHDVPHRVNGDPKFGAQSGENHPSGEVAQGDTKLPGDQVLQLLHQGLGDLIAQLVNGG